MTSKKQMLALTMVGALLLVLAGSVAIAVEVAPGVQVHGYMQNRVYSGPAANPEFRSERISVSALADLSNDNKAYVEWYYHPWAPASGTYLESAYFDTGMQPGRLRVGKGRRLTFGMTPAYPNRKTSNYGIVSEAFTQDRIQGVQYYGQKGVLDFGVSAHTGYRLGTRAIGEIPGDTVRNGPHSVPHLSFRDLPGELSNKLEVSSRLGGKWANGLKAGVSLSFASLDPTDRANLIQVGDADPLTAAAATGALRPRNPLLPATAVIAPLLTSATDDDRTVLGLDAAYKFKSGFLAQGEWYDASVSDLDYDAWNVLIGYEPQAAAPAWKFYARYSKQNMDIAPSNNPLSWDTKQITLSAVQPLKKGLWLQYEYEINDEDTDTGAEVDNNLFFVELFTGF